MDAKATGRDIILAILENMRESAEPLLHGAIVPSHFDVYLHRDDYERLSGILPRLRDETVEALGAELTRLGKQRGGILPGLRPKAQKYEAAGKEWSVRFHPDENEELEPGEILVDSKLSVPIAPEFGAGNKTQRTETLRSGGETRKLRQRSEDTRESGPTPLAKLIYQNREGQQQEYVMSTPEIAVGRGGKASYCDLELDVPADISRQHFYLRRAPETGIFLIQDVSKFGTSVNGEKLAPREWVPLPSRAKIALAERVIIDFESL